MGPTVRRRNRQGSDVRRLTSAGRQRGPVGCRDHSSAVEMIVDEPTPPAPTAHPAGARLSIDEFMKIDLRVAKVLQAERVPNSRKLIKMRIDLGSEERTIVAGIAETYEPGALVGRSVAIVANLEPARVMGIESNGMILAASPQGGGPILVTFDEAPAPGTRVR